MHYGRLILFVAAANLAGNVASSAAEVIGKAGATQMDAAQVRALVAALPEQSRAAASKDLGTLEQLVRAELVNRAVLAEAETAGFDRKPETVANLNRLRTEALTRLWLISQAQVPANYPSDADVAAAFEQNKALLQTPAEFHIAQIFISAPDAAEPPRLAAAMRKVSDLAPRLAGNADFGKLARENSEQAESVGKDGDLGWLAEDKILPEVLGAVRSLKAGEIAGPVKTAQGFHFLKLLEKRPGRALTLAESRERLIAALRARRGQELQQKYLADLGTRLSISVNQIGLASIQSELR